MERIDFGRARVEHVDEEVGEDGLLEGRLEGLDETVREIAHESDRVGEEERLSIGQLDAPRRGVEGGEELVLCEDVGPREQVEEGALSRVRVADDGGLANALVGALLALGLADPANLVEFFLDPVDAAAGETPVDLDLLLALAAGGGSAALATARSAALPVEVRPHPGETGQGILHAREFDWRVASRVRARMRKMSRMTSSRSITVMSPSSSQARCCAGASSLSKTMQSAPDCLASSISSRALPEPVR